MTNTFNEKRTLLVKPKIYKGAGIIKQSPYDKIGLQQRLALYKFRRINMIENHEASPELRK